MFKKFIYLWKKAIYSWDLGRCKAYLNLAQEAQRRNDISRAIRNSEKALAAGKKALNLSSEKYFPKAAEAKNGLQDVLELIARNRERLLILSQILSYQHQVAVEERELTNQQEEEIRNIRSALKSDTSEEAMDLDDRLVMILDIDSRLKGKRHVP